MQSIEGECYLRTKADKLKLHYVVVNGNELYCYKERERLQQVLMHCLVGTYSQELPEMANDDPELEIKTWWPLKVIIPPTKSRLLFFST